MEKNTDWRTESRTVYSNDFKLRIVQLASQPDANVAKIARDSGVDHNLIFKWLRLWQKEGRISRRLPATIVTSSSPALLPVEVIPDPASSDARKTTPVQFSPHEGSRCCVELRHGKVTLENLSPELLAVLFRELTGRSQ
jgi:transposase